MKRDIDPLPRGPSPRNFYNDPHQWGTNDRGTKILAYPGDQAAASVGFQGDNDAEIRFSKGCFGLVEVRLGYSSALKPASVGGGPRMISTIEYEGGRVFDNLYDALLVQSKHAADKSMLFAFQTSHSYAKLKGFLLAGSAHEYSPQLCGPGYLGVFDFLTAIQTDKGGIAMWESMPGGNSGQGSNPQLTVKHWADLPSHNYSTTFFVAIEIPSHKYSPPILKSKLNPGRYDGGR